MPKDSETKLGEYFNLPNPGLMSYLGNVKKGQPKVYDTPFAKGESTSHLLDEWRDELVAVKDKWPTLWDFEEDLAKKVGPLSVMKPLAERLKDVDSYYDGILLPSEPINHSAIAAVVGEWGRFRGLRLRSQDQTVALMKKSTNSGSPYFTKRRNVVDDTVPCYLSRRGMETYQQLPNDEFKAAAIIGWRGQEGGADVDDVKQRVVWMFPFAVNVKELCFYQPAIEVAQRANIVPAWVSMDAVDRSITKLFDSKNSKDLVVCTDFTKFDQHFNSQLQEAARQIEAAILSHGREEEMWLDTVFPVKYDIPLVLQPDIIRFGKHGMGSGSGGTNFDETMAHRALQYEAAITQGARLNPSSQCLGDDGILSYPGITVDDVVKAYSAHGLEMNTDKQYASTQDCVYLRRWHHYNYRVNGVCVGVYSTNRALGRLRYLERFMDPGVWSSKMVALRQLSILENVKYHPMKEQFVAFCMKRDKYRLGLDIPGFLDNIESEAQKAIDYMPDFLGYTKTLQNGDNVGVGIRNWWIVKYLKSM
nr:MAG: RNA-dependent RNA polymerase [Porcine picobirnavirus]